MPQLPNHLLHQVQNHVTAAGLSGGLAAELTDHLCCLAEDHLAEGMPEHAALQAALQAWPIARLRQIQRGVSFSTRIKPTVMKILSFAAVVAVFFLLFPFKASVVTPCEDPMLAEASPATFSEPMLFAGIPDFEPPTASPIAGVDMQNILTSGFGMRMHPIMKKRMFHRGIDLKAKTGTPVLATANGEVIFADRDGLHGLSVHLRHAEGYATRYTHLSAIDVAVGERVVLGDQVGKVGETGAATAPHLHYEVW
ncbi:MAG: M23 family metallopeptidase, partial [Bacteroidota bacterium]